MKRNFFLGLFLAVLVFGMNGCVNVVEEITFNKNGSGSYALEMDLSGVMSLMQGAGGLQNMLGLEGEGESDLDLNLENMDTTINFIDVIKSSGTDLSTLERKHIWESAKTKVKMNQSKGVMVTKIFFDFKDASDIKYFQENLSKMSGDNATGGGPMGDMSGMLGKMTGGQGTIDFAKKMFKRTSKKADNPLEDGDSSVDMIKMFMAGATYKTVYHFPRRVKATTIEGAKISKDKKTVTTEVEFLDLLEDSQILDGQVKLKRR